jgi:hypothetical protein
MLLVTHFHLFTLLFHIFRRYNLHNKEILVILIYLYIFFFTLLVLLLFLFKAIKHSLTETLKETC